MKDYTMFTRKTTRVEFRMATPADWTDVDKMWHHAAQSWRAVLGKPDHAIPPDNALQYETHDEYVVISFETEVLDS